jgi:hypothetical protein
MKSSYDNASFLVTDVIVLTVITLSAMLLMISEPLHIVIAVSQQQHCSKGLPCLTPSHQIPPSTSSSQTSSHQIPPSTSSSQTPPSTSQAPLAAAGENLYVTWWSNESGDFEVFFKASTDGGKMFGPKIDLSNSKGVVSNNAQIAASGNNVYITWWEHNATSNEPVLRVSNDNGKTFGDKIMLSSTNNTTKPR